jgi:hypothetical protein
MLQSQPAPANVPGGSPQAGAGRRGASVKTLKRMLKKAGLKTSGKKAALTRRAKKAHLKMGGAEGGVADGGRRRRRGGEKAKACFSKDGIKNSKSETECTTPDEWKEDPDAMDIDGGRRRRRGSRKSRRGGNEY